MKTLLLIVALSVGSAHAAAVSWTLNDVVLSDGQTLTGGFDYDADVGAYTNVSVFNSGGPELSAREFTIPLNEFGPVLIPFASGSADPGAAVVQIGVAGGGLTAGGGVLDLFSFGGVFGECTTANCANVTLFSSVQIVSGTISAVPIPAAVWLFGSALLGLGWLRRR